jgi:hypothetical protein
MKRTLRVSAAVASGVFALAAMTAAPALANGANTTGPYDPTATAPSANGNGNGKAVGRPDAGTVGNADAKNPKGQLPGPSDNNNGYECDGNTGIAKGNPAHTGCGPVGPQ